jgi:valyl-tRNA synthetase
VAIVDDTTVVHLLLVGVLDPALEVAKLEKKVRTWVWLLVGAWIGL